MSTASPARIAANKANTLKSTGPRTAEDKARVASNALKHGLSSNRNPLDLATDTALPSEREEFQATLAAFMDEFAPASPFEVRLVERLAQIDLRLQRAVRMETTHLEMHTGLLTRSMAGALPTGERAEQTQHAWLTTLAFLKNPSATTLIAQYESRLARDFARTLTQLRQAQKLRVQEMGQKLRSAGNVQNPRVQTQPEMPREHSDTGPCTTQQRHPSDGVVASPAPEIPAEQTQAPTYAPQNAARHRGVDSPTSHSPTHSSASEQTARSLGQ